MLKITYYQQKRNLGVLFLALVSLCSGISYFFFSNYQQLGHYTAAVIVYMFYNFHKNRNDKAFAGKHFDNAKLQMAAEYQLFLLAVSVPCLFTAYWYYFLVMHAVVFLIPFLEIRANLKPRLLFLAKLLKKDYIFISGVRRHAFSLLVFMLLALVLSPLKLFPLIALFIVNAIIFSFYEYHESVQMLQVSGKSPSAFLASHTLSALLKLALINAPVVLVNIIFNPDMLEFDLYFLAYNLLIMAAVIAMKYAAYAYRKEKSNFQIKTAVMMLGLVNPYLSVISLAFFIISRAEALKNLTHYLDDKH